LTSDHQPVPTLDEVQPELHRQQLQQETKIQLRNCQTKFPLETKTKTLANAVNNKRCSKEFTSNTQVRIRQFLNTIELLNCINIISSEKIKRKTYI
jgi:hypothetical protein